MTKRSQRSSPYPSFTIDFCVDLVTKIYTNFGSGNYYAKREEIAKVLGISTGNLQTKVSSANQYGLLDLKTGEGYKPSQAFISIYKPIDQESKKKALIEVFKSPPLYAALIEKFEGEILPSEIPLSNILLHHHSISNGANEKAADIFIENARNLSLLKEDNTLILMLNDAHSEIDNIETEVVDNNNTNNRNQFSNLPSKIEKTNNHEDYDIGNQREIHENELHIPFNIPLKGKRTAQIIVPPDVKGTDFDFIINFINLMKQSYD